MGSTRRDRERALDAGVAQLATQRGAPRLQWGIGDVWGGVKNVGSAVKKAVVDTGHVVGKVADNPWVQAATAAGLAATGVGAPLAAAIMAAERGGGKLLSEGGNIGDGLRGSAEGAAIGGASALAGNALRSGVASNIGGKIVGGLKTAGSTAASAIPGAVNAVAGGGGGTNWLMAGLAAAQAANAAKLGKKADDFASQGWDLANQNWAERAPLRTTGMAGLLTPQTRDLSNLTALRAANPVQKRLTAGLPTGGG